jgi:DNA-binding NarL/FixJ family response regulator
MVFSSVFDNDAVRRKHSGTISFSLQAMNYRVVLVDDHAAIRDLLRKLFETQHEFNVVGEAENGIDALRVCRKVMPSLVIIDLLLPHLSGAEVIRRLRSDLPKTRVVVFSAAVDEFDIIQVVESRPHGFVRKAEPLSFLLTALRTVSAGGRFFSPAVDRFLDQSIVEQQSRLSDRETEVLQLIAEGKTNKDIAQRLGVAVKTVDKHRTRLMEKLNAHNVAALTRYAIKTGLIKP